jgi:prefoldin subunit 5
MKNLEQMDLQESKSAAYDSLRFIEAYQAQLRAINEHIAKLEDSQKTSSDMKEPEKKKEVVEAKK